MATLAQLVKGIGPLGAVSTFPQMTFAACGRPLALSFDIVMAVLAFEPVAHGRGVLLVIEKHIARRALEHNPDGLIRGLEGQCCVSHHADQQQDHGKGISKFKLVFSFHRFHLP
jgi:hypothetical protein